MASPDTSAHEDVSRRVEELLEVESFPPPEQFGRDALLNDPAIYEQAAADPVAWWTEQARALDWFADPTVGLNDSEPPFYEWFTDGAINASHNCLDRHVDAGLGDRVALHWRGEEGDERDVTYAELHHDVQRLANALKELGIEQGDVVGIYLPMIPEVVVAMLACARIGAPHNVVFGGFSPESVKERMEVSQAKALITADGARRKGKVAAVKQAVDDVGMQVATTIVVRNVGIDCPMGDGDVFYDEILEDAEAICEPAQLDAEHPLFILYSSGSTAKPKGILHTTAGYLTGITSTHRSVFDIKEHDVFWTAADIGRAEVDVGLRLEVEDDLVRVGDARQVAAGRVQDALRLGRRAARVQDVQRVLGVERGGLALRVRRLHDLVVEDVAVAHRAVDLRVAHDDRGRGRHADLVAGLFDRRGLALAARAVDGDQRPGLGDLHALLDGLRREAAEDDVVRGADPRAGEHRDDDLGDHRQVDPDDIALLDALVAQRVGEALDVGVELGVGDVALLALLPAPVKRDAVAEAGVDVAIEAVVGGVDRPALKPLVERRIGVVEHRVPLAEPVQLARLALPPRHRVGGRLGVDARVVEQRVTSERLGRREGLDLQQLLEALGQGFVGFLAHALLLSRSSMRRILPVRVFGRSSTNSTMRGYAYADRCSRT